MKYDTEQICNDYIVFVRVW